MALTPMSTLIDNKKNLIMGYDRYQVEEAVRTLQRSKEIERDPSFMRAIQFEATRQQEALKSITKKDVNANLNRVRGGV